MKSLTVLSVICLLITSCNHSTAGNKPHQTPRGEFAFLLQYNGRMPADVGFLTNHIVERRMANLLKDSFQVFMSKTKYALPIYVDSINNQIVGSFYNDSLRKVPSAYIMIDVNEDALWVDYYNKDSTIAFADNPSLKKPGPFTKQ